MNSASFGQSFSFLVAGLLVAAVFSTTASAQSETAADEATKPAATAKQTDGEPKDAAKQDDGKDWKKLSESWAASQFGGDGPVEISDKVITFGFGDPLTGIRWEGDVIRENYEIELEARRTEGFDFFCGLTFPVGKDHVSFILGGWGGGIVGISSIDGRDASENDTTSFRSFNNEQWYKIRVRVDPFEIRCWIDDKVACSHPRKGFKFDIRYEMDQCVPLGLAAFQCKSELRGIRVRKLTEDELSKAKQRAEEFEE